MNILWKSAHNCWFFCYYSDVQRWSRNEQRRNSRLRHQRQLVLRFQERRTAKFQVSDFGFVSFHASSRHLLRSQPQRTHTYTASQKNWTTRPSTCFVFITRVCYVIARACVDMHICE